MLLPPRNVCFNAPSPVTTEPATDFLGAAPRSEPGELASRKLKVINFFGAPCVGKSSVRSGLFWLMKSHHLSAEEVSEYAKYLVLAERKWQLSEEQIYLFAKQYHKQLIIARSGYEYAVTDSPLQLCAFYAPPRYFNHFEGLVDDVFESFENINFFLTRNLSDGAFENRGRTHSQKEAEQVELDMREFLDKKSIVYVDVPVDIYAPWKILDVIQPGLALLPKFPVPA